MTPCDKFSPISSGKDHVEDRVISVVCEYLIDCMSLLHIWNTYSVGQDRCKAASRVLLSPGPGIRNIPVR